MNDMYDKYVCFIDMLLEDEEMDVCDIKQCDKFKDFRRNNLITFREAHRIDIKYTGNCGSYWRSAYDYPNQGDIIKDRYKATNVGLLTFDIIDYDYINYN